MLDIRFIRENPDAIEEALKNRHAKWDYDEFRRLDEERREIIQKVESLKAERNTVSKQIGAMLKEGNAEEAENAKIRMRDVGDEINNLDGALVAIEEELNGLTYSIPNIPGPNTPIGDDEDDNPEVRRWGTPREFDFETKAHWDLGPELGIIDFERGVKLAHARLLRTARCRCPPRALAHQLHAQRAHQVGLHRMVGSRTRKQGNPHRHGPVAQVRGRPLQDDRGAIPHPHGRGHAHQPACQTRCSTARNCPSATAHTRHASARRRRAGRDTRGIIRVHQFDKVEMVRFAKPDESDAELENMTSCAEKILQKLGLPYRVISLCTGDLGFSARQTYDLEVWLPSYGAYKEISSCSNCGDFQARRANIKFTDENGKKHFAHTLNGSGLAVGRTMAAIIENYQNADGTITVPEALRPYMGCDVIAAQ